MRSFLKKIVYLVLSKFIIRLGDKQAIYITFDDGPHPENTPKILDILDAMEIRATFFMTGIEMEKHIDVVKEIATRGHQLAYHSYNHISMKEQSFSDFINEMNKADEICNSISYRTRLYRPPYGDLSLLGFLWLLVHGWKIIMWSLDSRDSFDNSEQILENIHPNNIQAGEILLFHDDYEQTLDLLPKALSRFREHNFICDKLK